MAFDAPILTVPVPPGRLAEHLADSGAPAIRMRDLDGRWRTGAATPRGVDTGHGQGY
jgi:hypothetical protein